ncbi:hypothetical protein PFISCL1PPCAC_14753, partial [Pristionchus fissidentatus]
STPRMDGEDDRKSATLRFKIDGSWVELSESQIFKHPGGAVINQYEGADATHIFHAFHAGSAKAYKQLTGIKKNQELTPVESMMLEANVNKRTDQADINIAAYDISIEQEKKIVSSFESLRREVTRRGWMEGAPVYCCWKIVESAILLSIAAALQYNGWFMTSAVVLGLAWQQLGWIAHEFCHQQPFKDRSMNDTFAIVLANFAQGLSRDWWKDKHNTHHAATNVVDQDGDIEVVPLFSFIRADLLKYKAPIEKFILKFIPYQHLYFTLALPLIRYSWVAQSIQFAFTEQTSSYRVYRRNALGEQLGLVAHWAVIGLQLYYMPDNWTRFWYFLISQSLCGLLLGHVVTYSHNSVDKYPANSRILNNFACLQILTTRNMAPSRFIDWFWGGLNYQVEHHLFPTMPRCYLNECSKLVKAFCKENGLEYLVDDYMTGYAINLKQLENIAEIAAEKEAREE